MILNEIENLIHEAKTKLNPIESVTHRIKLSIPHSKEWYDSLHLAEKAKQHVTDRVKSKLKARVITNFEKEKANLKSSEEARKLLNNLNSKYVGRLQKVENYADKAIENAKSQSISRINQTPDKKIITTIVPTSRAYSPS